MNKQKGFSIIELIIVVVIIGIIAAIAVPNLLSARRTANEATTISALRTIHQAEASFQISSSDGNFGTIANLTALGLIHSDLANATTSATSKNGYFFTLNATPRTGGATSVFECDAQPAMHTTVSQFAATGSRRFYIIEAGVIYFNLNNAVITVNSSIDRTINNASPLLN